MSRTSNTAPAATELGGAVATVDEHLTAYGHAMTWAPMSARSSQGTCGRCAGRVLVYLTGQGPRAMADPHMTTVPASGADGGQDYAECPGRH